MNEVFPTPEFPRNTTLNTRWGLTTGLWGSKGVTTQFRLTSTVMFKQGLFVYDNTPGTNTPTPTGCSKGLLCRRDHSNCHKVFFFCREQISTLPVFECVLRVDTPEHWMSVVFWGAWRVLPSPAQGDWWSSAVFKVDWTHN